MVEPGPIITAMRRVEPAPGMPANGAVARFDCAVGGILLLGMKLHRLPDGSLRVPNVTAGGSGKPRRGIIIQADALRAAILAAALVALDAMPEPDSQEPRRYRGRRAG